MLYEVITEVVALVGGEIGADVAAEAIQAKQAQGSTNYTKIFDNLRNNFV